MNALAPDAALDLLLGGVGRVARVLSEHAQLDVVDRHSSRGYTHAATSMDPTTLLARCRNTNKFRSAGFHSAYNFAMLEHQCPSHLNSLVESFRKVQCRRYLMILLAE